MAITNTGKAGDTAQPTGEKPQRLGAALRRLTPLVALGLFLAALWLLDHELERYRLEDLVRALAEIPPARVAALLLFTLLSYTAMIGYDALAMKYIGRRVPLLRVAFAAFEGFSFSQNIALGGVTGASIRYRLYTGWGLSAAEVAALVVFNALSFWLGFLALGGIALIIDPAALPPPAQLHPVALRLLGVMLLAASTVVCVANALRRRPWKIARWEFRPAGLRIVVGQIAIATLDWGLAAAALYVLLPPGSISYPSFLGTFLLAQIIGLISHVPGGIGIFETVLLASLAPRTPVGPLLAALVVFRVVYYLLPLLAAATLLAAGELARHKRAATELTARLASLVPAVLATVVFVAGTILLVSGATPGDSSRLHALSRFLPLPFVELSHFMGSVAGALLLLLARGIQRRQRSSFSIAVGLMGAGIAFSLLKGLDYEEATLLAFAIAALAACRHEFYRKASLFDERFTARWAVAVIAVIAGTAWLSLFAHKHTEYSAELWWQFAFDAQAPRSLRAEVGIALVAVFAAGVRLLRPPRLPGRSVPGDLDRVRPLLARARNTSAYMALLGDKQFLLSASGDCALMYGARGRSCVAFGDPIGADHEKRELIWAFRELCDRNGSWPAFYEVGTEHAGIYRDLGLGRFKLGEEARVRLADFKLEGRTRKTLRAAHNRGRREGLAFEIIPRESVPAALPELSRVSAEWLAEKNTGEKGFSLGYFDERYLRNFPIAIVQKGGTLLAFANILEGAEKDELSVDLMRHRTHAPPGTMDYLFVELMLWGKDAGYLWFDLGMAPLSGLASSPPAPSWDRAGAFLYRHGEHFYNFEGLRSYKAKFDPVWSPRYLVCPAGIALPFILADIAALVSGSAGALVARRPRRSFFSASEAVQRKNA